MEDADEGTESDVAKPSGGGGGCVRQGRPLPECMGPCMVFLFPCDAF